MSDVELKEHVEILIKAEREQREAAQQSLEHRLSGMNELREQITSERGTFVSRELFDRLHEILLERISSLENSRSNIEGRMTAFAIIIVIIQIAVVYWAKK